MLFMNKKLWKQRFRDVCSTLAFSKATLHFCDYRVFPGTKPASSFNNFALTTCKGNWVIIIWVGSVFVNFWNSKNDCLMPRRRKGTTDPTIINYLQQSFQGNFREVLYII